MEFTIEIFQPVFDVCDWITPSSLTNIDYYDSLCKSIIDVCMDEYKLDDDFEVSELVACINKNTIGIALELSILYN